MPTIKFRNPASDADKVAQLKTELKDLEQELALRQNTGRDLVTQLLGEKDARKEVKKKCAGLQQEHLRLQDEHTAYVLAAARAEQANEELQAKLQDLQEDLFNVEVARNSHWEDCRQALIDNNRLTQEVESLKAQVAAMQKAHSMTPAQLNTQSTVEFPFALPHDRVNTARPTFSGAQVKRASFAGLGRSPLSNISNTQVLYDRARLAGFGLSPLDNVSNTQGFGRLQPKRTTPTPLSKTGLNTSSRMRPPSALLGGGSAKPTSSKLSPAIKSPLLTVALHTPVGTPKADLLLATPTSAATGVFAPPAVGTHSLWARSPSMDSQTYRDIFRDASSCGSDCEEPAPASTPRPSWVLKAGSSHNSSKGKNGAAFTIPESAVMPKVGSSSGVYSPPPMSHISGSPRPLSTSGAVLAIPGPAKATEVEYLRWRYRCTDGSCSCLGSLVSEESSPEISQRLQSAESSTPPGPPSDKPKYLSRQEVLEEHWGYGHSSCSDSESDVSAVSECTICSEARWNPAATASSPLSTRSPHSNTLHLDIDVSYGELNIEPNWLLLDSPLSTASTKSLCPVPGAMATPPSQLSPASPGAACHTSSATAAIVRSTSGATAAAGTTAVEGGPTPSSVKVTRPSPRAAARSPIATAAARSPLARAAARSPIATAAARSPLATAAARSPIATAAVRSPIATAAARSPLATAAARSPLARAAARSPIATAVARSPLATAAAHSPIATAAARSPLATAAARSPIATAAARSPLAIAAARSPIATAAARSPLATAAARSPIATAAARSPLATAATRSPIATAAAPSPIATARPSCKATASPSTTEARGSSVQSGRAAAPRPALRTSSAAGEPVQRGTFHHQSTTATAVTPALQPAHPAASSESMSVGGKKSENRRLRSTPVPAVAGVTTRRQTAAAGVITRGQAAAAAQHKTTPTSGVAAASSRSRQARSLKPEAPIRRQPQRAAKPQWR